MRLLTPAIKYWVCKSAPGFFYEAMECLGGNGYVEEGILARHYRESPVNAIWEGSGNVMCLDVLQGIVARSRCGNGRVAGPVEETRGLPGAAEAAAFIGRAFRRADSERVARLGGGEACDAGGRRSAQRRLAASAPNCSQRPACRESR